MLASFYHATLLKHENLGSALSYMLANKLSSPIMPAIAIREVVEEAYAADPEMIALLRPVIFRRCVPVTRQSINTQPRCYT